MPRRLLAPPKDEANSIEMMDAADRLAEETGQEMDSESSSSSEESEPEELSDEAKSIAFQDARAIHHIEFLRRKIDANQASLDSGRLPQREVDRLQKENNGMRRVIELIEVRIGKPRPIWMDGTLYARRPSARLTSGRSSAKTQVRSPAASQRRTIPRRTRLPARDPATGRWVARRDA